ncbi:uncharacterized protein M6B38_117650 [Iris pallida]|uniref:AATF leucine zipper-containing domain-containing protein n=1 Tax=Iris pallida TaxID=29817 RepID=A0AAX6HTC9_IRIPA|nr:uncharacterized protein M6B38_117650 [Iris pallida]
MSRAGAAMSSDTRLQCERRWRRLEVRQRLPDHQVPSIERRSRWTHDETFSPSDPLFFTLRTCSMKPHMHSQAMMAWFLLQKPFSSSNKLPQEPVKSSFCSSDTVVDQAYADLVSSCKQTLDCLLELQEDLLEQNHSIIESTTGKWFLL